MKKAKSRTRSAPAKKLKKPRSASMDGFGILNPDGDFWSPTLFEEPQQARVHFDRFWASPGFEGKKPKWSDYKVVPARSRITAIKPKKLNSARAAS